MTTAAPIPTSVHLVGSMALPSVDAVFEETGRILGSRLKRVPDGEPGGRNLWISWQYPVLRANPFLEVSPVQEAGSSAGLPRVEVAAGVAPGEIEFGELGYSREARASYIDFCRARDAGRIPAGCRFQVCLPTPLGVLIPFVTAESLLAIEPAYEAAMVREVDRICAEIPHEDLAFQWDICIEMVMWDGRYDRYRAPFDDVKGGIVERVARISRAVPEDVELGVHLCYGDWGAKHFIEPVDAGAMTELANAIVDNVAHPIAFIHMPVPVERTDDAFFAPFAELKTGPETEIYLGLVHDSDGIEGTKKRIEAANKYLTGFGVASECGLGRCKKPDAVRKIFEVHAGVSKEPV